MAPKPKTLSHHHLIDLAAEAKADPRTVAKEYAKQGQVKGRTGDRVRAALVKFIKQREAGAV